jgi:hypothetical protein
MEAQTEKVLLLKVSSQNLWVANNPRPSDLRLCRGVYTGRRTKELVMTFQDEVPNHGTTHPTVSEQDDERMTKNAKR